MLRSSLFAVLLAAGAFAAPSSPAVNVLAERGPIYKEAVSLKTDGRLRYVENSGICETTPGVNQYSGYVDIGTNQSMWFWFFEARNNPEKAPFALWINGGPGCSSMIGLFQEHGPCTVNEDGASTSLNPYSWNEYANMIYVDQPIGTGFSYGTDTVNTTWQAAPQVWKFFQLLFTSGEFEKYESREFGFWTESYGGHYGPAFSEYFQGQNAKISNKTLDAEYIHLKALGINNGWFDPRIQNDAYVDFSQAQYNGFFDIVNASTLAQLKKDAVTCHQMETKCYETGTNTDCHDADQFCTDNIFVPAIGNQDSYYILRNATDPFPSEAYVTYLQNATVQEAIGAQSNYSECPDAPYERFVPSGDDGRSTLSDLARVVDTGLRTLIWAGDVDYNCNWLGGYRCMEAMPWKYQAKFNATGWTPLQYGNQIYGLYKTAGNLSFAKIFNAGHEVPAYQPVIALELFKQTMELGSVQSVPPYSYIVEETPTP